MKQRLLLLKFEGIAHVNNVFSIRHEFLRVLLWLILVELSHLLNIYEFNVVFHRNETGNRKKKAEENENKLHVFEWESEKSENDERIEICNDPLISLWFIQN